MSVATATSLKRYPTLPGLRERDQRLDGLKAALGKVAHDFNNQLAPLRGYVSLLQEELTPGTTAAGYASTLETATLKTERYVENILMAIRPGRRFSPQPLQLAQLITAAVAAWKSGLPEDSHISATVHSTDDSLVLCDQAQWSGVIQHLLSNARHALATGGELEVKMERCDLTFEMGAELNVDQGPALKISVRDNGFGMSAETLAHCFEPFFTTRNGHSGGLGLSVVHSVAQLHGGQVSIESVEDVGTTVTMWVPIRNPAPGRGAERASIAPKMAPRGKILLVEDDPLVREVIRTVLMRARCEVIVGSDGVEGLKLFQRHGADVRLVITDIIMPNMNGVELYRAIRESDPHVNVIFVTGEAAGLLDGTVTDSGALVLQKPFALKTLSEAVRERLE